MPGHRWDPEKKRFFKIVPGPSTSASGSSSGAQGSGSRHRGSKQRKTEKQKQETPRPPLPALPTAASGLGVGRSAFGQRGWDPVAQRQQARNSVAVTRQRAHQLTEAAYSQLALTRVLRPFDYIREPCTIASMSTDFHSKALLVSNTNSDLVGVLERPYLSSMYTLDYDPDGSGPSQVWQGPSRSFYAAFHDGALSSFIDINFASGLASPLDFLDPNIDVFELPRVVNLHGSASWASCCLPSSSGDSEDSSILAIAPGKNVHVFTFVHTQSSLVVKHVAQNKELSDIMALALDPTGRVLYVGLRSGIVRAWSLTSNTLTAFRTVVAGQGSVTNLAVPSCGELLVVRITGEVSLVTPTGDTIRTFDGHVNSYHFDLGFALDPESRVMALAGIDNRVRVWSLDLSTPFKTSAAKIPVPKFGGFDDESVKTNFKQAHEDGEGRVMEREDALGTCVFPKDVTALLWHRRMTREDEPAEVGGFKDLYVGAGEWVYHFTWP